MRKVFASPARYIQGKDELTHLAEHAKTLGKKPLILISEGGMKRSASIIESSFKKENLPYKIVPFGGEASKQEVSKLRKECAEEKCDMFIGIGGGKILDSVKAAAYYENVPVIVCPTVAASDAPCSALTVLYTPSGEFEEYLFLPHNPNIVLVDEAVIAKSPVRLTISGMGDALATYFEAETAISTNSDNFVGGKATLVARGIARLCYETLLNYGPKAVKALRSGVLTPAVSKIIEANTLMSGLGFESCGIGAAHSIHNGLTALEPTHAFYHGEKVAFGVMTQLILEDYDKDVLETVAKFCVTIGLPVCFADLNLANPSKEDLLKVAELACAKGETIHNGVIPVSPEDAVNAMIAADEMGKMYKTIYTKI